MDIIQHIKDRGMTVAGVARKAGVSRQTMYDLQSPERSPSVANVVAVAKALDIRPEDIRSELGAEQ